MANALDISNLTLNPAEAEAIADFVIEAVPEMPSIAQVFQVNTRVKLDTQLVIMGALGMSGIADTGCTRPESGATMAATQKYWTPRKIGDTFTHCQADVNALFKPFLAQVQRYEDLFDISGTDAGRFLTGMVLRALPEVMHRIAWFGDTAVAAATDVAAGLVDAADIKFYNRIDGLWKQIFADVAAAATQRVTIAANAEATKALQLATFADGYAYNLFEEMYSVADTRLRQAEGQKYLVTRELFDNYRKYLRDKSLNFELGTVLNGLPTIRYDGKEVINMEAVWNGANREKFAADDTHAAYYLPHRAILTAGNNLQLATLDDSDAETVESWYERKERQLYTAYGFTLDAKTVLPYLNVVAY